MSDSEGLDQELLDKLNALTVEERKDLMEWATLKVYENTAPGKSNVTQNNGLLNALREKRALNTGGDEDNATTRRHAKE